MNDMTKKGNEKPNKAGKKELLAGAALVAAFILWTYMIQNIDVQPLGINGTDIGFASFNAWFHNLTGVHMIVYTITDWLGLVPIFICIGFGVLGFWQMVRRRSILKVDPDILILGAYYILVIFGYLIFEMIPINYRPILINGYMEASYPSSTTLLVLSVMPTLRFQTCRRVEKRIIQRIIKAFVILFSLYMVIGRMTCGVHWFTDIVGSVLLSFGLFLIYKGVVKASDRILAL